MGNFYWATRIFDIDRGCCKSLDNALILRISKCDPKRTWSLCIYNASVHSKIHEAVLLRLFESQQTDDAQEAYPRNVWKVFLNVLAKKNRL